MAFREVSREAFFVHQTTDNDNSLRNEEDRLSYETAFSAIIIEEDMRLISIPLRSKQLLFRLPCMYMYFLFADYRCQHRIPDCN